MPSLLALSRAASEQAKAQLHARLWVHLGTFVLTISTFWLPEHWAQLPAAAAVITEAIAWALRASGDSLHGRAEEAKRAAILCNAYGTAESIDASDLRAGFSDAIHEQASKLEAPEYYASTQQPGPERLREVLQESAFFSKHLFAAASRRAFVIAAAPIIALSAAIVLAAPFSGPSTTLLLTRVLVAVLSLLISADAVGQRRAWRESSQRADRVDHALDAIASDRTDALTAAMADYGVATSSAPPIPTDLYEKMRKRLNQSWDERQAGRRRGSE